MRQICISSCDLVTNPYNYLIINNLSVSQDCHFIVTTSIYLVTNNFIILKINTLRKKC